MKDPLFGNKVAAAGLVTLLLAVGMPIVINTLGEVFGHHGHHDFNEENPFDLAYIPTDIKLDSAPPKEKEVIDLGTLLAAASADRGERAAGLCKACHTFNEGGANGIGPNLWNVVNREIAGISGFGYSGALESKEGVWSYEELDPYLANSSAYIPGTQMAQIIRKPEKRADILAYLASLSDTPVPFPAPAPVEEAVEGEPETADGDD